MARVASPTATEGFGFSYADKVGAAALLSLLSRTAFGGQELGYVVQIQFGQRPAGWHFDDILSDMPSVVLEAGRRYSSVTDQKAEGAHYTPTKLARFVASKMVSADDLDSRRLSIIDPAVGDGELLLALLSRLEELGVRQVDVHGFDMDARAVDVAKARISQRFPLATIHLECGDFLSFTLEHHSETTSLFCTEENSKFDLLIANPPYVRTQVMGSEQSQRLAQEFGLTGRVDLYHAFLRCIGRVMKPQGKVGIIVSNRFMTTKSGAAVRADLLQHFEPLHIWDLGDTRLFSAAVLPAVLLLQRKGGTESVERSAYTTIYTASRGSEMREAPSVFEALSLEGIVLVDGGTSYHVQHGELDHGECASDVWRIATASIDEWNNRVDAHTWARFRDLGKVRVGVKSTADRVFIRSDWQTFPTDQRPELLRPLTTHHSAGRFKPTHRRGERHILYPHESISGRRSAVDLTHYPRTEAYLRLHEQALRQRTYIADSGREWFELWVPHDPDLWSQPKVVFRDICEQPTFWMDESGSVVNGDCYWLTCDDRRDDELLWLALAVGNSTFIEKFYDHRFNNKLYAGRRRFMTQYVREFPLPDPSSPLAITIANLTKVIFASPSSDDVNRLETEVDQLVWESFGFDREEG